MPPVKQHHMAITPPYLTDEEVEGLGAVKLSTNQSALPLLPAIDPADLEVSGEGHDFGQSKAARKEGTNCLESIREELDKKTKN